MGTGALRIDGKNWDVPDALARRLARAALHRVGGGRDVSRVHLDRMVAFLRASRPRTGIELPGGLELEHDARGFRLGPVRNSRTDRSGRRPSGAC